MKHQIGILSDPSITQEIVNEAKKALAIIESKYNCKFEILKSNKENKSTGVAMATARSVKEQKAIAPRTLMSFGGELDF